MSLDVIVERHPSGCPKRPIVIDSWTDTHAEQVIDLANDHQVYRSYSNYGALTCFEELDTDGALVKQFVDSRFGHVSWTCESGEFTWGSYDSASFVPYRSGQRHGLVRMWDDPQKSMWCNMLYLSGKWHGLSVWRGVYVGWDEFRGRLPRARDLTKVLPLSVARRLISFL